jgi:hypothetical protein
MKPEKRDAVEKAQDILARYVEPGPRDCDPQGIGGVTEGARRYRRSLEPGAARFLEGT